ncbi:MAG: aldose 1-epimerase [Gemmata sp.]
MAFEVRTSSGRAGDRGGEVYELTNAAGTVRAEVWPQWGFNCLKWQLRQEDGRWADILFHMPDWESNPVPTRSGHPILFPFPGRLREGRLPLDGRTYQLPLTESSKLHSIHGFTPRLPWRVTAHSFGNAQECAAVTGEFSLATDFPEALAYWPTDFVFQVTYRLYPDKLRVDARAENVGAGPLPCGLGYHGYFVLPGVNDADVANYVLQANVSEVWAVDAANLPTGERKALPGDLDFQKPRALGATALDHVFRGVTTKPGKSGLAEVAVLAHPKAHGRLRVLADNSFGDLVLFTPAHRRAVAIEPYSCAADASNLAARGVDTGWRVVPPGGVWESAVEYRWEPTEL